MEEFIGFLYTTEAEGLLKRVFLTCPLFTLKSMDFSGKPLKANDTRIEEIKKILLD